MEFIANKKHQYNAFAKLLYTILGQVANILF